MHLRNQPLNWTIKYAIICFQLSKYLHKLSLHYAHTLLHTRTFPPLKKVTLKYFK